MNKRDGEFWDQGNSNFRRGIMVSYIGVAMLSATAIGITVLKLDRARSESIKTPATPDIIQPENSLMLRRLGSDRVAFAITVENPETLDARVQDMLRRLTTACGEMSEVKAKSGGQVHQADIRFQKPCSPEALGI